jgi:hypothetical protein
LFLSYLHELQKGASSSNAWFKEWLIPVMSDDSAAMARKLQPLDALWINNVTSATNNPIFEAGTYFTDTWRLLNELEKLRKQRQSLQAEIESVQERLKRVPDSLDKTAYVGLFIVDPKQPRRGLEMIRFDGP